MTPLLAQTVKCLTTMRETRVQSQGWEDPLEKEMATHSSILAWEIPWVEEPGRLQSMGSQRVRHDCESLGVGSLSLLQRFFPTQESNCGLLHCRQTLYHLTHQINYISIKK